MTKNPRRIQLDHPGMRKLLGSVERPGRYVGGEFGSVDAAPREGEYSVCIVFPDLYEIAMSNQAVRILYRLFNDMDGVRAERAFSPAPDFRKGLDRLGVPLFSLENRIPVADFDLVAVTVGYELAFTNVLSFLESSGIPIGKEERTERHPFVIAGGPAMTNPAPWMRLLDGVFIGEAEGHLAAMIDGLRTIKAREGRREETAAMIAAMDGMYTDGHKIAERAVWNGFVKETGPPPVLPVPSLVTVQDHGVVEIMRGCPNKCRFCHAGVFYRPFRQKSGKRILEEVEYLVNKCGYREITLSSLSTGDYSGLEPLVEALNRIYSPKRVSFSLPSLRVNSVNLSLIGRLGSVRRGGLTFAVETPTPAGQKGINKEVPADRVIGILNEAKRAGWKLAKFYFMLGLPVGDGGDEENAVVEYLLKVQKATGMKLNVNLGTFIPKPHTPFERSPQLTDEEAMLRIRKIRDGLRDNKRIKLSYHSPFVSFLEGILSRGDERAGLLAEDAWHRGAEFDAWDDRMDKEAWRRAIEDADWDVEAEICRRREAQEHRPWDGVSLGITSRHLETEEERVSQGLLTPPCGDPCAEHCGVCGKKCRPVYPENDAGSLLENAVPGKTADPDSGDWRRLLVRFKKDGPAMYLGHLDMMSVFERSLQRAGICVDFTRGYNPKPRIEFAQPLTLGICSEEEILTIKTPFASGKEEHIVDRLNGALPKGLEVTAASWIVPADKGRKTVKVMSAFWGSDWLLKAECTLPEPGRDDLMQALESEGKSRGIDGDLSISTDGAGLSVRLRHGGTRHHNLMRLLESAMDCSPLSTDWTITRIRCLAKGPDGNPVTFSEAFPED